MSGDNVAEVTQEAAPVDEGPREIVFAPQQQAVEQVEQAPAKADAAGLEEEAPAAPEKPRTSMQERMDEVTRARREAEREAEYWKARAQGNQPQPKQAEEGGRPARDSFDSDDQYLEALADWKVDQRLSKKDAETTAQKANEARASSWNTKLEAARADFPDHQAVLDSCETPIHLHLADALQEHEHGAKVAYELAKNPELIEKLNGMSATQAAFEVAKLGAQFDKPAESSPSPKPAAVSKAPPPPATKVGANRSTAKSPEDMSMAEYVEHRAKLGLR